MSFTARVPSILLSGDDDEHEALLHQGNHHHRHRNHEFGSRRDSDHHHRHHHGHHHHDSIDSIASNDSARTTASEEKASMMAEPLSGWKKWIHDAKQSRVLRSHAHSHPDVKTARGDSGDSPHEHNPRNPFADGNPFSDSEKVKIHKHENKHKHRKKHSHRRKDAKADMEETHAPVDFEKEMQATLAAEAMQDLENERTGMTVAEMEAVMFASGHWRPMF